MLSLVLKLVPFAVLFGVFLNMGVSAWHEWSPVLVLFFFIISLIYFLI
jgi:hypothetical protein